MAATDNLIVNFVRSSLFDPEISPEIISQVCTLDDLGFSKFLSDIHVDETCTRDNFVERFVENAYDTSNLIILIEQDDVVGIDKYFSMQDPRNIDIYKDISHSIMVMTFEKCSMECFSVLVKYGVAFESRFFFDFVFHTSRYHTNPLWEPKVRSLLRYVRKVSQERIVRDLMIASKDRESFYIEATNKLINIIDTKSSN